MRLFIKYTSRSRPNNFFRGLDSIVNNLSDKDNYTILCSFDEDDLSMNDTHVLNRLSDYKNVVYYFGLSKTKVDAINRDLNFAPDFDILINMSDDMVFTKKGFDDIIRKAMSDNFPDTDGWLHFYDGNQNRLSTMSIFGKKYFDRFGFIYHPDFISVYCDNREQDVAKILGKYKYMGDEEKILLHIHPLHGHGIELMDDQYKHTESFYPQDRATYNRHIQNNFYL